MFCLLQYILRMFLGVFISMHVTQKHSIALFVVLFEPTTICLYRWLLSLGSTCLLPTERIYVSFYTYRHQISSLIAAFLFELRVIFHCAIT